MNLLPSVEKENAEDWLFSWHENNNEIKIEGLFSYLSQIENSRISITWRYELLKHFISKSTRICNKNCNDIYKTISEGNYSKKPRVRTSILS